MGLPRGCGIELHSKKKRGRNNLITDVPGVKVGHVTIMEKDINTGVTAVLAHDGNLFRNKVMAGISVINGCGKSTGLLQIEEMGVIETPIILTNTFAVGTAMNAVVKYMLVDNPDIGGQAGTVNCVVAEGNDGRLNDIRGMHITEDHVIRAINSSGELFGEGSVGGGTGMCCLGVKGGIGSASRIVEADGGEYVMGALVMSNFGPAGNLVVGGKHIPIQGSGDGEKQEKKEKGSTVIIIATDLPLNERQLKRVCKRAAVSLGRCGSILGSGSGDIAIGFSTANLVPHYSDKQILHFRMVMDEELDDVFEAAVEAIEEAIVSSLYHAKSIAGVGENNPPALQGYL